MKVIERKDPPNTWPREFVCGANQRALEYHEHCGSKLEVEAADIAQPGQRDGDRGWFRCPVCNELNYVDAKTTSEAVRYRARQAERPQARYDQQPGVMLDTARPPRPEQEGRGHDCNYA